MPRAATGPSPLSQIVANLKAQPRLALPQISSLRLTLAARNDHFGARYFLKEQLPRIRFANPDLQIAVRRFNKHKAHNWRPDIVLSLQDGTTQSISLHGKWSTTIVREVMEYGGSPAWTRWKEEVARSGAPLLPGAEHAPAVVDARPEPEETYDEWLRKYPRKERRAMEAVMAEADAKKRNLKGFGTVVLTPEEEEAKRAAKKEAKEARLNADRIAEEEAERRVQEELAAKAHQTGAGAILP
ncbi:L51-S25-CI-B8 domain-containing protein [Mycena kentingensis (nom. inval.)]|nr:L51-S25-CI-B8 domain-containing protein [Mycena kentingensis (nom. inval.)]